MLKITQSLMALIILNLPSKIYLEIFKIILLFKYSCLHLLPTTPHPPQPSQPPSPVSTPPANPSHFSPIIPSPLPSGHCQPVLNLFLEREEAKCAFKKIFFYIFLGREGEREGEKH